MIRGNFGIRPGVGGGGGTAIRDWDALTAGTPGERRAVLVDGEPVVVQMGSSIWQIATPSAPAQAVIAANPRPVGAWTAPTVPRAQWADVPGWRLQDVGGGWFFGGERRCCRTQLRNASGRAATKMQLELANAAATSATYEVAVGTGGSEYTAGAWSGVATVTVPAAADGIYRPGYASVVVELPEAVSDGGRVVISVRPPESLAATANNAWLARSYPSGLILGSILANAAAEVDGPFTSSGIDVCFGVVGARWIDLPGDAVVQVAHFGDSVGEQEPPLEDTAPNSRQGWQYAGNIQENANGDRFHWNGYANGSFTPTQYLARLSRLLSYPEWVAQQDVVSIQVWSRNDAPSSLAAGQALWESIQEAAAEAEAVGLGVVYTLLTPPSVDAQAPGAIEAWEYLRDQSALLPHVHLYSAIQVGTEIGDAYSQDGVHVTIAGQALMGALLPEQTSTALSTLGYF